MKQIEWKLVRETLHKRYYVSNVGGKLKSISKKSGKEREIKIPQYKDYLQYNGLGYIHRLVAEAFVPNPYNKTEVDHIDGNKLNNDASNLRWSSHKENINNPTTLSKHKFCTGYHWYNNGKIQTRAIACPEGFVNGKLK